MTEDRMFVDIVNLSGKVQRVRNDHPILLQEGVEILLDEPADEPADDDPFGGPYEDWTPDELKAYAREHGIDVGKAKASSTLASRIRAVEAERAE